MTLLFIQGKNRKFTELGAENEKAVGSRDSLGSVLEFSATGMVPLD